MQGAQSCSVQAKCCPPHPVPKLFSIIIAPGKSGEKTSVSLLSLFLATRRFWIAEGKLQTSIPATPAFGSSLKAKISKCHPHPPPFFCKASLQTASAPRLLPPACPSRPAPPLPGSGTISLHCPEWGKSVKSRERESGGFNFPGGGGVRESLPRGGRPSPPPPKGASFRPGRLLQSRDAQDAGRHFSRALFPANY